ncbi:MAG: MBL fold metallo-hydrolase [Halanaerobium sp.]
MKWLGNAALEIRGEENIIIDPNFLVDAEVKADIVLITHEHDDHINPEDLKKVMNDNTKVYAPQSVYDKFDLDGEVAAAGQIIENNIKVLDVDCYNSNASVAYFYNGVYHTADAADFPDPGDKIKIIFTACFNDYFADYIENIIKLNPEIAVPYHYNPEERQELLQAKGLSSKYSQIGCKSRVLELDEEIEIE